MKLPRRNFLRLAAGAAALPAVVSRVARAQAYPSRQRPVGNQTEMRFTLTATTMEWAGSFTDRSENEKIHGDLYGLRG